MMFFVVYLTSPLEADLKNAFRAINVRFWSFMGDVISYFSRLWSRWEK